MGQASSNGKHFHVAIIGGGASGTLSAIQLLQLELPLVAHVFNDGFEIGRGVAYSAPSRQMVLNVPACNMSAFPDQPAHFAEWLQDSYGTCYTGDCFVPRHIYGDYLRDTLQVAVRNSHLASLRAYHSHVTKLLPQNHGYAVFHANGEVFADAVILALGSTPPARPNVGNKYPLADGRYIPNPWNDCKKIHGICGNGTVVILGSGLTAVDMILQLRQQGCHAKIILISRRGLWLAAHKPGFAPADCSESKLKKLAPHQLIQALREKARMLERQGGNWRQVVDGLRPETNQIWAGWTLRRRQSFIRHLEPYWNVHRHRVSPAVWNCINEEIKNGTVQLKAGRIVAIRPGKEGLAVAYCLRHQEAVQELQSGFVINCAGPETLHGECRPALIQFLLDRNLGQLDPLGHGLATASDGSLLNADGHAVHGLFTIGPLRKGKLWETTAIPEIRVQAKSIAHEIYRCLTRRQILIE